MQRAYSRIISDEGATAIEYAIMAGFIAAVIVGTVYVLGQATVGLFQSVPPF
jgi:Flp pilus assembly pilin Flp